MWHGLGDGSGLLVKKGAEMIVINWKGLTLWVWGFFLKKGMEMV